MSDKMKMLGDMLAKKGGSDEELNPEFKRAKLGVLKDLHKHMGSMLGDDMGSLSKVTVAAPDEHGLEMGLDKAKSMLPGSDEESSESPEMEASEDESMEEKDPEDMSSDELQAKIEELQALQKQKMMEA